MGNGGSGATTSGAGGSGGAGGGGGVGGGVGGAGGGGEVCLAPKVLCNATCVDTSNDPAHCGSCGHDCLGGECFAGHCQMVALATGQIAPRDLAVDDAFVYWTDSGGTVMKVAKAGGDPVMLASNQDQTGYLALDADFVYWTTIFGQTVMKVPKAGGASQLLAVTPDHAHYLALSPGEVFFGSGGGMGALMKVGKDGSGVTVLSSGPPAPTGMTVVGSVVYWGNEDKSMKKMGTGGGVPSQYVIAQNVPGKMIHDQSNLYWVDLGGVNSFDGRVMKAAIGSSDPVVLAANESRPIALAVDQTHVYWVLQWEGMVRRVPIAGGAVEALVTQQMTMYGVAVDEKAIYWTVWEDGTVMKLAK
jgi:hypothetical protein